MEFGTAPSAEPGAPPVVTNDILAMVSPERESVPLLKVGHACYCIPLLYLISVSVITALVIVGRGRGM